MKGVSKLPSLCRSFGPRRQRSRCGRQASVVEKAQRERGAALVIAILVLSILTVTGIALLMVASTESRVAANEWSVNRAFYAADAGIRWGTVQMDNLQAFLARPEFAGPPPNPFGTVFFQLPSHNSALDDRFGGGMSGGDIAVRIQTPSLLGRRPSPGGRINEGDDKAQYVYAYEMRSTSADQAFAQFAKALVADVEVGPLPARLPF